MICVLSSSMDLDSYRGLTLVAMFEAVNGLAPDIGRKGVANPLRMLISVVKMFNHMMKIP